MKISKAKSVRIKNARVRKLISHLFSFMRESIPLKRGKRRNIVGQ